MRRGSLRAAGVTALLGGVAALTVAAPALADGVHRNISSSGTARFIPTPPGSSALQFPEFRGSEAAEGAGEPFDGEIVNRKQSRGRGPGGVDEGKDRARNNPELVTSFDGLTGLQQRTANGGKQFSVEPPDQGLCAGNGFVLESVNDVLNVYDQQGGSRLGVTDLNSFYGYPAQIDRATGLQGPFVTDPSCLFDEVTQRWIQVVLTLEVFPSTGDFTGRNTLDIAVSTSPDPLGTWKIYHLPVQDDGTEGTPNHDCAPDPDLDFTPTHPTACIGDYPHIGADANGFYISTNEYPLFPPEGFHAAQLYAFSKAALAAGADTVGVTQFDTIGLDRGNPGFTIWPSTSPAQDFATAAGGTEFFMSSNAAEEANGDGSSRDLLVWSLTNTQSLNTATPDLRLDHTLRRVGRYGLPPTSDQEPGDFPLGQCLNDTTLATPLGPGCWRFIVVDEPEHNEVESRLDSLDTRMQQVVFAGGRLYGALGTALTLSGENKAGIEWFIANPRITRTGLRAPLVRQGYLGMNHNNVTMPAIGVLPGGRGVMAFTLVGRDHFPSAAYAPISAARGVGDIHVAKEGLGPSDGFTSYKALVGDPPRTRWGDYGAAAMDGDSVWLGSEYIGQTCTLAEFVANTPDSPQFTCGLTRAPLINWYTRISRLRP
jgi:hypothetical protein